MKILNIAVSSNGWEYSNLYKITYKDTIKFKRTHEFSNDSTGKDCPDTIVIDNSIIIQFDEGFEVLINDDK